MSELVSRPLSMRVAGIALQVAAVVLAVSMVALFMIGDVVGGFLSAVLALIAAGLHRAAVHRHDAVRMVALAASVVLALLGVFALASPYAPGIDAAGPVAGPYSDSGLVLAAPAFAVAGAALIYNLFVDIRHR